MPFYSFSIDPYEGVQEIEESGIAHRAAQLLDLELTPDGRLLMKVER